MGHVRLLVILLVAATLLVDLAVVSWVVAAHPVMLPWWWSHPSVVALFALCFAQVGLIAIWTGFGGRSLPWRLLGLALTIGIWARVCALALAPMPWDRTSVATNWTLLLLGQSVVILVPLWAARLRGVRLVRASTAQPSPGGASDGGRFQFSLGYLLSWITVLAVILGLAQYGLPLRQVLSLERSDWEVFTVTALSHAGLVLAGLWAVLSSATLRARCLVVVLTLAAAFGASRLVGFPLRFPPRLWPSDARRVLALLCVVASLLVFRVAGYRMTRLRRAPRAQAEEPPAAPNAG